MYVKFFRLSINGIINTSIFNNWINQTEMVGSNVLMIWFQFKLVVHWKARLGSVLYTSKTSPAALPLGNCKLVTSD